MSSSNVVIIVNNADMWHNGNLVLFYSKQVCELANLSTSRTTWSELGRVPYIDDGLGNWVSFDNVRSVLEKVCVSE